MKISGFGIEVACCAQCKSTFYSTTDILNLSKRHFSVGDNRLIGEIDSGNWAISYLLSMYPFRKKDFIIFDAPVIVVDNGDELSLETFCQYSCYLDPIYPMFSNRRTSIERMISQGLKKSGLQLSLEDIKELFNLNSERCTRPLHQAGNEIYSAMAAIGFAHGKQVFCFPWFSQRRFEGFHQHLSELIKVLAALDKIVIAPTAARND